MQDLRIEFSRGPMAGETSRFDLGTVVVGREPRSEEPGQSLLVLRGADGAVSRNHALIYDRDGLVYLKNTGGNGTKVDGKLTFEETPLSPGSVISIGSNHEFTLDWQGAGLDSRSAKAREAKKKTTTKVASTGMLASPVVRSLLVVYLLGIAAVAVWLSWRGSLGAEVPDDWPRLGAAYESYQPEGVSEAEKARRARLAEAMLVRLRVLRTNERTKDVHRLCRELMRLDSDIESPLYRYGAKCLGKET